MSKPTLPPGMTILDLVKLAQSEAGPSSELNVHLRSHQQIVIRWIQEMDLKAGAVKEFYSDIYKEFTEWCKFHRLEEIPSERGLSVILKPMVGVSRKRGESKIRYSVNQTTAEMRKKREKQERQKTSQEIKDFKGDT